MYCGGEKESVHVEESERHHVGHGRVQIQSAMRQKEEYEPTEAKLVIALEMSCLGCIPQSSKCHRGRCACCASHGRHHQHRDGPRTQQKRSYCHVSSTARQLRVEHTYSREDVDLGAGISQRTSRP